MAMSVSVSQTVGLVDGRVCLSPRLWGWLMAVCLSPRKALGVNAVPYGPDFPLRPLEPTTIEYLIIMWVAGGYLIIM